MLTDIEIAKKILFEEDLKICIVKNKEVIYKSIKRGIYPMYDAVINQFNELEGASVADRVVGRAAALLNVYAKVATVYSEVISENALALLKENEIEVSYDTSVSGIQNREKNDACPIEKISSKVKDYEYTALLLKIKEFLIDIKAI